MDDLFDQDFFFSQLEALGLREFVGLIRIFLRNSRELLVVIDQALVNGDRKAVRECAHKLRSASGCLGLACMTIQAGRLEAAATGAPRADLAEMAVSLRACRQASLKALMQLRRVGFDGYLGSTGLPSL